MDYKQEVAKYGKKDAVIAMCAYVLIIAFVLVVEHFIIEQFAETARQALIIRIIRSVVSTVAVFAIVMLQKQKLRSIGIHKKKIGSVIRLGLLFIPIPLIINVVLPFVMYGNGVEFRPFVPMAYMLATFFFYAVWEDILFVGFLQTRIYGLFKTDKVAISIVAILFSLPHITAGLATGGLGLDMSSLLMYLAGLFFMHQMFVLLFRRHFSLLTVVIVHTITNWSYTSVLIWLQENDYSVFWSAIAGLALIVAVNIWDWRLSRRNKKAAG